MDDLNYVLDGDVMFSSPTAAMNYYKKQYYMMLEENKLLTEELQALIRQNNELQRLL